MVGCFWTCGSINIVPLKEAFGIKHFCQFLLCFDLVALLTCNV